MAIVVLILGILFSVGVALGQAAPVPQAPGFLDQLLNVDFVAKLIAFGAFVQLALYCLAEVLTRFSAWLDDKSPSKAWLQKAVAMISQASWILGVALGKFGYSVPKLVFEEKAKELSKPNG